ncbi:TIGR03915 family putative DNA repair protein [Lacinutrix sp. MedPE-SW]|uniref:TIGR03915 family putative DNA repair protein n=1 Tax=Lacinutrix sp. MedPE-SW TaxID=1860087 RepID=UPI00090F2624|nr:TIGR03915 family putative DNA repair protein [Lacinutrix sp. MedPE-SW]OIQ22676.1 MAG: DNA metabolism protein [Lacinutrix sp. MedPE-SW]
MNTILIYDGTFDGFLTCVFVSFDQKLKDVNIVREQFFQDTFFAKKETVITQKAKADRVWVGLKKKIKPMELSRLYYAFLSESITVENTLFKAIQYIFKSDVNVASNFANTHILEISKLSKSVGREKHRMEAFVRFKLTKDNIYFANIEPDFNVLPLISKHFKNRYADQKWMIYDLKRNYGIYYNLEKVDIVTLEFDAKYNPTHTSKDIFCEQELEFQQLWKDYFKSTNIVSRKNLKLHKQHVPKRYWKYLSEKQPN